jgi:hypothetical protein
VQRLQHVLRLCQADEMDVYRTRRTNLRALAAQWGGPTSLAKKLGHSNGSYLAQLIGPNPSREVSEKTAREIERNMREKYRPPLITRISVPLRETGNPEEDWTHKDPVDRRIVALAREMQELLENSGGAIIRERSRR